MARDQIEALLQRVATGMTTEKDARDLRRLLLAPSVTNLGTLDCLNGKSCLAWGT